VGIGRVQNSQRKSVRLYVGRIGTTEPLRTLNGAGSEESVDVNGAALPVAPDSCHCLQVIRCKEKGFNNVLSSLAARKKERFTFRRREGLSTNESRYK
jgi:hypothetical protein